VDASLIRHKNILSRTKEEENALSHDDWLWLIFGRFLFNAESSIAASWRPYALLVIGIFSLLMAVIGTYSGETPARFAGVIRRTERPKKFWMQIITLYLLAACCIGYFLYNTYGPIKL